MLYVPRRRLIQQQPPRQRHRGYQGCCGSDCECSVCPNAPAQWSLSVAGITTAVCEGCAAWNGSWVLTNDCLVFESGNPCKWSSPVEIGTAPCEPGCGDCSRWTVVLTSSVAALLADESQMAAYRLPIGGFNCTGANTFPLLASSLHCDNWPASLTITPV
jgi:hypothetical protein